MADMTRRKLDGIPMKRKGQFFLLGAFMLAALFLSGFPRQAVVASQDMTDMRYMSLNLQKEYPNAFNLGSRGGDWLGAVKNFTWFADNIFTARNVNISVVIAGGNNISTTDYNVTIFNYHGNQLLFNITIGSTMRSILVGYNQSNSTTFSNVGSPFNISFRYPSGARNPTKERNTTWVRDKGSIYGFVRISSGDSAVINEFEG